MKPVLALILVVALSACASSRGPRGGDPERQLAEATVALDVVKVRQLLSSGADPNKMVTIDPNTQSPWAIALHQLRPRKPETVAIALAMLDAGANPNVAWGDASPREKETFWQRMRHARTSGIDDQSPLRLVMFHPDASVVRALIKKGMSKDQATGELAGAVESGEDEIARLLVDAGADVNARPSAVTPLVAAVERRDMPMMILLEEHGAREKP